MQYIFYDNFVLALSKIEGTYGIIVYNKLLENIIVAKKGSPIVMGISNDKIFISSDYYSFLEKTQEVITIKDNEIVIFDKDEINYKIKNIITNKNINPIIKKLNIKINQIEKSIFKHFIMNFWKVLGGARGDPKVEEATTMKVI